MLGFLVCSFLLFGKLLCTCFTGIFGQNVHGPARYTKAHVYSHGQILRSYFGKILFLNALLQGSK